MLRSIYDASIRIMSRIVVALLGELNISTDAKYDLVPVKEPKNEQQKLKKRDG